MKTSFRNPWPDIREGRNLDAYVVALLAVLVAVLSLFGVTSVPIALAVVLSTLVVVTAQNLRMTALLDKAQTPATAMFQLYDDSYYGPEISRCNRVSMLVTANDRFLAANGTAFRSCLDAGGKVRELLFDTSSDWGMRTITSRSVGSSKEAEYVVLRSKLANSKITELAKYAGVRSVEVRRSTYPAAHVVLWLEFSKKPGVVYLTPGAFGIRTDERLTIRLDEHNDKDAYLFYANYFENLWEWQGTVQVDVDG
jgi:hypothetical protein